MVWYCCQKNRYLSVPMNRLTRWLVWLSHIHCCRGFGIQSPTDYAFVRYVVNEHWPYYAYDELSADSWLQEKLGRLYLRLANWRQPTVILSDDYQQWFHAGCHQSNLSHQTSDIRHQTSSLLVSPSTIGTISCHYYHFATSSQSSWWKTSGRTRSDGRILPATHAQAPPSTSTIAALSSLIPNAISITIK